MAKTLKSTPEEEKEYFFDFRTNDFYKDEWEFNFYNFFIETEKKERFGLKNWTVKGMYNGEGTLWRYLEYGPEGKILGGSIKQGKPYEKYGLWSPKEGESLDKSKFKQNNSYAWKTSMWSEVENAGEEDILKKLLFEFQKIVDWAKNGDFNEVSAYACGDDRKFGPNVVWKIAYMFSSNGKGESETAPGILPIYGTAAWKFFNEAYGLKVKNVDKNRHEAQQRLMKKLDDIKGKEWRNGIKFFKTYVELWTQYENLKDYFDLLDRNKNLILTGAPGTGKTFLAKRIAMMYNATKENGRYVFVQFHPSYDYTDFVEGLRPTSATTSGSVGFERRDGVFKEFCKNALKELEESPYYTLLNSNSVDENGNLQNADAIVTKVQSAINKLCEKLVYVEDEDSSEDTQEEDVSVNDMIISLPSDIKKEFNKVVKKVVSLKTQGNNSFDDALEACQSLLKYEPKYIFVIDEINRGEMSKIFGELFFSIDPGYRGKDGIVQTQYQNLIDQNGNDPFKGGFYVPENVYIIGTMNDIDRSVDSMDFAMRRRFVWKEVTAKESAKNMGLPNESVERMSSLNEAIENVEGLDSSYHIGAAYFLKLEKCGTGVPNETNYELLWKYSIEGVVKEYLRGMADSDKTLKKLKKAYDRES